MQLGLLGRPGTIRAIVEPNPADVFIGTIVLEDLNLLAVSQTRTPHPPDPDRVVPETE